MRLLNYFIFSPDSSRKKSDTQVKGYQETREVRKVQLSQGICLLHEGI